MILSIIIGNFEERDGAKIKLWMETQFLVKQNRIKKINVRPTLNSSSIQKKPKKQKTNKKPNRPTVT